MSARHRSLDANLTHRLAGDPGEWLSCDECFRLLDVHVDAAIRDEAGPEFTSMANHLATCQACREEAQTLVQLAAADSAVDEQQAFQRLGLPTV